MTTTTFNTNLERFNFSNIEMSELNLRTFTVEYRYFDDQNWFKKEITAESIEEAAFDAQVWIESENATIGNRPKAGNYIAIAFVREWNGQNQKVLEF
jgi:hypothetical protein